VQIKNWESDKPDFVYDLEGKLKTIHNHSSRNLVAKVLKRRLYLRACRGERFYRPLSSLASDRVYSTLRFGKCGGLSKAPFSAYLPHLRAAAGCFL